MSKGTVLFDTKKAFIYSFYRLYIDALYFYTETSPARTFL